ncbi:MAG: porin [Cupriavidus sp.]|uniref:porin n=1 Tax=Cupriavidus TaxID=106589 RepID=UPI000C4C432B|nr:MULTISPECIES: porin [Cupriavidus]MBU64790.1 porin [Cupriavidus sp.]KAB0600368.1 porin [Cupriavidus pauculus]KAI3593446.1 Outer membrane porin [Cupriavidus sp. U2]MBY4733465.1 porin [Cupriavidus pauculus]UAL03798.1 porin [Cupriavidus pauculus]
MKKQFFVMGMACAVMAPAWAVGSVTLYGILDEGVNYTSNVGGHSQVALESGFPHGSRWGIKGTEPLGGGLQTVFQLENGFMVDNGRAAQGGLLFGRQAYVGIVSDRFGTVTAGRQYDLTVDFLSQTSAAGSWGGYMFGHPYDNDNMVYSFRVNNTLKYTSPLLGGVKFGGAYSFSNDANFARNRQFSFGTQYTQGGLLLAAAYLQANQPSATPNGAINNGGDQNLLGSRLEIFGAGATYSIGASTFGLVYSNTNVSAPKSSGYVGPIVSPAGAASSLKFQNFEVNAKYQFAPSYWLGAMYTFTRASLAAGSGRQDPVYHSFGFMADYAFSKRTDIYMQGVYQRVAGDRTGTVLDAAYVTGAANVSSNRNQLLLRAAIRHFF